MAEYWIWNMKSQSNILLFSGQWYCTYEIERYFHKNFRWKYKVFFSKSATWKNLFISEARNLNSFFFCFPIYEILWVFFNIYFQFRVLNIEKEIILLLTAHFFSCEFSDKCSTLYVVTGYEISNFKGDAPANESVTCMLMMMNSIIIDVMIWGAFWCLYFLKGPVGLL